MDRQSPDAQNSNQKTEYIPHSGVSGTELPVNDFDNTTLREADDRGLLEVPERVPTELSSTHLQTSESEKSPKKKFGLGAKIGAGAAGIALIGGAIFGVNQLNNGNGEGNTPPEDDPKDTTQVEEEPPVDEEPPVKTPENETPAEILEVLNNPNRVSPEEIAAMTPEELKDFATITPEEAPTPEAYAEQVITVLDAWMMAGTTQEEWSPYASSGYDVYEDAMAEKYDKTFSESLFMDGVKLASFQEKHRSNLTIAGGAYELNPDIPFDSAMVFESSEFLGENNTIFGINATYKAADNYNQTGYNDIYPHDNIYESVTYHLSAIKSDSRYSLSDVGIVE